MTMSSFVQHLFQNLADLLYPAHCAACGHPGSHFCQTCQARLDLISPPYCIRCGYPLPAVTAPCQQCLTHPVNFLNSIRSVAFFENTPLRPAIHKLKYRNNQAISRDFAILLADCYDKSQLDTDTIVPVPLHPSRYRERGYNQSALLGRQLSKRLGQPVNETVLVRDRVTKSQMSLKANERKTNVAGAFNCTSTKLTNKSVLLIDDVCTTGATLDACAQALRQAGVGAIHALTLARAR